ncbi:MAG TPA: hypothetical protein VF807_09235 [Ktedonobacterales bacterium]
MRYLRSFALFWYDFIVGDDWTIALAVLVGLVVTALLARAGAWWLLPLVVVAALALSLYRVTRPR